MTRGIRKGGGGGGGSRVGDTWHMGGPSVIPSSLT